MFYTHTKQQQKL